MKKFNKYFIGLALSFIFMFSLILPNITTTKAEHVINAQNVESTGFYMEEGASIRKTGGVGIRFRTFVSKAYLTKNKLNLDEINLGTEFILSNRDSNNVRDLNIVKNTVYEDTNNYIYNSVIYKIPQNNYTTNITARSFIKKSDDTRIYVENPQYRSIHYVATKALENGETDTDGILNMIKTTGDNKNLLANFDDNTATYFNANSSENEIVSVENKALNVKSNGQKPETVLKVSQRLFENVKWSKISKIKFTITNNSDDGGTLIIRLNGSISEPWLNKETKTIEIDANALKTKLDEKPGNTLDIVFYHGGAININLVLDDFKIVEKEFFRPIGNTQLTKIENGYNVKAHGNETVLEIDRNYFDNIDPKFTKFTFKAENKCNDASTVQCRVASEVFAQPWLNTNSTIDVTFDLDVLRERLNKYSDRHLQIVFWTGNVNDKELNLTNFKFI